MMKGKQVLWLLVALVLVIVTGVLGVRTAQKVQTAELTSTLLENTDSYPSSAYVAILRVSGTISEETTESWYPTKEYDHAAALSYVNDLMADDDNTALYLIVDSPGGSLYASDELYLKLMEYKKTTGRKIYCYFKSTACSGGYYIAMAADEVYANRNCTTGSIGVIMSTYNLSGLYDKLGIKAEYITSGANKALGAEGVPMTDEQRAILQQDIDEAFTQFVEIVADGRGMTQSEVRALADGRIYTAKQAVANGLIDGIMTEEEYDAHVMGEQEQSEFYEPESDFSASDIFNYLFSKTMAPKKADTALSDTLAALKMFENKGVRLYAGPTE